MAVRPTDVVASGFGGSLWVRSTYLYTVPIHYLCILDPAPALLPWAS